LPGRNDTLLACLALASFLAFERWRESGNAIWAAASVPLGLAALLTKETAIVLFPLLLLRWWLLARPRPRWGALVPVAAGWAVAIVAWLVLRRSYHGVSAPLRFDSASITDLFGAI